MGESTPPRKDDSSSMNVWDAGKSPAFQFYPADFLADEGQTSMSLAEAGAYIRLLCRCWLEGSIPDDLTRAARLVGVPVLEFKKLWPTVRACFVDHPDRSGRLTHPRLERERLKQTLYRRRQADAAAMRWNKKADATALQPHRLIPEKSTDVAIPVECSSSSSSSSSSNYVEKKSDRGSRRPIYTSDRFAVFEWQLDELGMMLGAHLCDFDLHSFFDDLTQRSRADGLVIPKQNAWPWLQSQVLAEAERRGLPIAQASSSDASLGKLSTRLVAGIAGLSNTR